MEFQNLPKKAQQIIQLFRLELPPSEYLRRVCPSRGCIPLGCMHRARPGKKLIEGSCDSFVAMRIVAGEEYWRVVLAGVAQGCPIEISRAIRGETKAFATSEYRQIYGVLLAF